MLFESTTARSPRSLRFEGVVLIWDLGEAPVRGPVLRAANKLVHDALEG
jgi:hypothetical protein